MLTAEFTALGMLSPVIVTVVAATLLRQRVSALRWSLICGGFGGALIVIGWTIFGHVPDSRLGSRSAWGGMRGRQRGAERARGRRAPSVVADDTLYD